MHGFYAEWLTHLDLFSQEIYQNEFSIKQIIGMTSFFIQKKNKITILMCCFAVTYFFD